jgi:acyl carrier protein
VTDNDSVNVRGAVFESLCQAMPEDQIGPELTASCRLANLGLDSLKLVEIVYELETRFNVTTDEDMLAELVTVADLIRTFEHALTQPE